MTIGPGARLAHYEILTPLGKGGMGEVWRAKDGKLGREVAIKILPEEFAQDAERMARFEREARLLASLSHPNIAAIYGFEQVDGLWFLVLELARGEDLSNRMRRGRIPVEEAIETAKQIASALEAAHEQGIVHRDLKPGNVMADDDGNVKVLDFGLAKALDTAEESATDYSNSPTMVRAATNAGIILGTAGYMSPEQARGRKVDRRADIWAFGVVVWEMLTGERLFAGETISDTLAAVLTRDVDFSKLPAGTPPSLHWVLGRCLERDPRKRLRDIGEARLAIEGGDRPLAAPARGPSTAPARRTRRELAAWALCGLLAVALAFVAWKAASPPQSPPARFTERLSFLDDANLALDGGSAVVISHDGRTIVLVASDKEGTQLYLNRPEKLGTFPIPGTRNASAPFFSPDDQWIGFFADGKLKKVATGGGAPVLLCDAGVNRGGTWGDGGKIVFAPGVGTGLFVVSENGGTPEVLTRPRESAGERSHRWPEFLPGGNAVVFVAQSRGKDYEDGTIQVVSLKDRTTKVVCSGGSYPRWAASGHLLFAGRGTLLAVPFDLDRLETRGSAVPVVQQLLSCTGNEAVCDGSAQFSVSTAGTLVYRPGVRGSNESRIAVVGSDGVRLAVSTRGSYLTPAVWSAPGRYRIAVTVSSGVRNDIWIWEMEREAMTRLTFDGVTNAVPVWSPDGSRIGYSSTREVDGTRMIDPYVKSSDGSGVERPLVPEGHGILGTSGWATSWGDRILVYQSNATNAGPDVGVFALHLEPGGQARPNKALFVGTNPDVSPDGRWIAYQHQQPGERSQIMVRPVDDSGMQYQVSNSGGKFPRWTKGGREIVWNQEAEGFWAASITARGGALEIGAPRHVLDFTFLAQDPFPTWDVSDDGAVFVGLEPAETSSIDARNVILSTGFFDELRKAPRN